MLFRAENALEMLKAFYLVIIRSGISMQITALAIHRKGVYKVLVDLQNIVNLSNKVINI